MFEKKLEVQTDPLIERLLEYHCHSDEERQEYISRGLIPVNNLSLRLNEDAPLELIPGLENPHHYHNQPWGHIVEHFRLSYPDLWEAQKITEKQRQEINNLFWEAKGEISTSLKAEWEAAIWENRRIKDEIFRILAPEFQAAGFDPFDLTG